MFCLRSYLVLLFLPINASPIFVVSFFLLTYLLNRPCVYCSILLLILFVSSCYWSEQCFFDLNSNWFEPRHLSSPIPNPLPHATSFSPGTTPGAEEVGFLLGVLNDTATALAGAAGEEVKRKIAAMGRGELMGNGTGGGDVEGVKSWLLGAWRIPCLDVYIRL